MKWRGTKAAKIDDSCERHWVAHLWALTLLDAYDQQVTLTGTVEYT